MTYRYTHSSPHPTETTTRSFMLWNEKKRRLPSSHDQACVLIEPWRESLSFALFVRALPELRRSSLFGQRNSMGRLKVHQHYNIFLF
mmetsp:Transcript_23685/g.42369  ORF Transcript_23685/g.42369 Transcript_23685/m.42369 type:complete len:87 (+) Transcript_23685:102-362(+)